MKEQERYLVGIDWAHDSHQVCLLDITGEVLGERSFPHGGAGLAALCDWIVSESGAAPGAIEVAIEVPHGPVVEALLERGFSVFSINPKQLDRLRDRHSPAGAKDDRLDAYVLGDSLRNDRYCLRALRPQDPIIVELREYSRLAEELRCERGRLTSRLQQQLWRYYPQALELTEDLGAKWFLEFWRLAPTPEKAVRLRESTIADLLKKNRVRRFDAAGLRKILRRKPLSLAPGTSEAAQAHIRSLIPRLELVNRQIAEVERQIDALCDKLAEQESQEPAPGQPGGQRDVEILRSSPGLGRINIAALLSEAAELLQRRDYHALRSLSGVAPVTKRSGKSKRVVMRWACNTRLRNAVYHWARVATQKDPFCRARYAALRARGHSHARALRSLADRLLAMLCAMLRNQTPYDPKRHRQHLAAA